MNVPIEAMVELAGVGICLTLQALFAGAEIAMVGSDRLLLKHQAESGDASAERVLRLLERPTLLVGTCLIGTATFSVSAITLFTFFLSELHLPEYLVVLIYTPISIIFAELIPKSVFHQFATMLAPWIAKVLGVVMLVLKPVLMVMEGATRLVMRLMGIQDAQVHSVRREDIQLLLDDATIHAEEKEMIQRVFDFSDTLVQDVMVPLIEVVAIPDTSTCEDAAHQMAESGHSRVPIYRRRIDRIVGMVSHQDVIFAEPSALVTTVMRPVMLVPEQQRLEALFWSCAESARGWRW